MTGLRRVIARALGIVAAVVLTAAPVLAQGRDVPAATDMRGSPPQAAETPPASTVVDRSPDPRPLHPPADPVAAQAYAVLDTHCARCHQGGRLNRPAPAAGFGNILRLDEIARDPALVWPGNPDASRLYTHMLRRLMPYDGYQEKSGGTFPKPDEIQAVRAWISRLEPAEACRDRRFITREALAQTLARSTEQAGSAVSRHRFVSLAHLYNDCASPDAMTAYRQAVVRLLNSLSWKPGPVRVEAVDEQRTLLRFDLADLGWLPAHWERILAAAHNASGHLLLLPKTVTDPFGTAQPVARGDWLADTILKAPLYYDLLGLPVQAAEIERILQIDTSSRRPGESARRLVKASAFAQAGRIVEHFGERNRTLWSAYDAALRDGRQDLTEAQIAPTAAPSGHDAVLSLFMLPNGMPAYVITNARGERVDKVPADIAKPSIAVRTGIRAGADCMACHAQGPAAPRPEAVAGAEIDRIAARDRDVVRESLSGLGIDPGLTLDRVEPIVALIRQFARPLSAERAAAELGTDTITLTERLASQHSPSGLLARRLMQGLVGRGEFESQFRALLAAIEPAAPPPDAKPQLAPTATLDDPGPGLILTSDKVAYSVGDPLTLSVRAKADCHLTVVSIDQRGRGTVIFPSDFEPNNLLTAGSEIRLPADGAPYLFRLKEKGRESVVAICSTAAASIDGIKHDFERQRFTDLGNYSAFLLQALATQVGDRRSAQPPAAAPPPSEPKSRGRRRAPRERSEPADVRARPDQVTHTAITIEVR